MRLNNIRCTHNGTGGSGPYTVVRQGGGARPSDAWGTTGSRNIEWTIVEFTDSTQQTILQGYETIASYNLATDVVTIVKVNSTWVASTNTYLPLFGSATAPSALSIGNTAANVAMFPTPTANGGPGRIPFKAGFVSGVTGGYGCAPTNIFGIGTNQTLTSGQAAFSPIKIEHDGPFSQASIYVVTAFVGTTSAINLGIYECLSSGTNIGLPGRKLIDFGTLGAGTSTGMLQGSAIATPVDIGLGWFWMEILYVATGQTTAPQIKTGFGNWGPAGGSNNAYMGLGNYTVSGQSSLSDPAATITGFTGSSGGAMPWAWFL